MFLSGPESSGDLEADRLGEGKSPLKKKAKLDSSQHSLSGGADAVHRQEVPSKKSAEVKADHFFEDLDPEALDYEPEAEQKSLSQDRIIEDGVRSSVDTKGDVTNQHVALKEDCNLKEEVKKDNEAKKGGATATSNDIAKVDNWIEPESVKSNESEGRDDNIGGLTSTSVTKEDEGSKLEDKTEPIDPHQDLKNLESTTVNEKVAREAAIKAAEESNKDLFNFTRIPVKVREPLKLPRRAADMLSSGRPMSPSDLDFSPDSPIPPQSPPCALSDLSESDSELESLASECSTMTAVSELSMGDEDVGGDGPGKIKRRGMKKKRKDRRRLHGGKCSKEQPRLVNFFNQVSFL